MKTCDRSQLSAIVCFLILDHLRRLSTEKVSCAVAVLIGKVSQRCRWHTPQPRATPRAKVLDSLRPGQSYKAEVRAPSPARDSLTGQIAASNLMRHACDKHL